MDKMQQDQLISVIVPVYNVEKYLVRCIDSLLEQSYKNLEIILVDDGATDQSGKICDEYALKDTRIKVIHKANGGLSDARNCGLDIASGALIGFVDSDDYIAPYMYENLVKTLHDTQADLAICRYKRFKGEKCTDAIEHIADIKQMDTAKALDYIYSADGEVFTVAWNKLYKREVIADIRYPVKKVNEDEFTTYKFIANAKKIAYTSEILYFYFHNDNSITTKKNYLSNKDIYEALDERIEYLSQRGFAQLECKIQKQYLDRIIWRNKTLLQNNKEEAKQLLSMYRERYAKVKKMVPGFGYKLYHIWPAMYYFLLKFHK